jgi:hypothetical protein
MFWPALPIIIKENTQNTQKKRIPSEGNDIQNANGEHDHSQEQENYGGSGACTFLFWCQKQGPIDIIIIIIKHIIIIVIIMVITQHEGGR